MVTILGGLAEFERELIRARTGEGRARAKAKGVKLGRTPILTPHQQHEARARREKGENRSPRCPQLQRQPQHYFTAEGMSITPKETADAKTLPKPTQAQFENRQLNLFSESSLQHG